MTAFHTFFLYTRTGRERSLLLITSTRSPGTQSEEGTYKGVGFGQ